MSNQRRMTRSLVSITIPPLCSQVQRGGRASSGGPPEELEIFSQDALYIESWGPEYRGAETIRHWFQEWNTRGTVLQWDMFSTRTAFRVF